MAKINKRDYEKKIQQKQMREQRNQRKKQSLKRAENKLKGMSATKNSKRRR